MKIKWNAICFDIKAPHHSHVTKCVKNVHFWFFQVKTKGQQYVENEGKLTNFTHTFFY